MTRAPESAIRTESDDLGTRAPGLGCTRSGRSVRCAAAVLLGLVGLAVYAPLLAGDRPLLVHARLPGHIEAHRKRLSRAFAYDIRHGLIAVLGIIVVVVNSGADILGIITYQDFAGESIGMLKDLIN